MPTAAPVKTYCTVCKEQPGSSLIVCSSLAGRLLAIAASGVRQRGSTALLGSAAHQDASPGLALIGLGTSDFNSLFSEKERAVLIEALSQDSGLSGKRGVPLNSLSF